MFKSNPNIRRAILIQDNTHKLLHSPYSHVYVIRTHTHTCVRTYVLPMAYITATQGALDSSEAATIRRFWKQQKSKVTAVTNSQWRRGVVWSYCMLQRRRNCTEHKRVYSMSCNVFPADPRGDGVENSLGQWDEVLQLEDWCLQPG